jgi:cytochrome c oxidase subunit IV
MSAREPAHHPRTLTYLTVGAILTVLTAMEVIVYNVKPLAPVLVPVLLVLMVAKFVLVCFFYMHLGFDDPFYAITFSVLLFFATLVVIALYLLFFYHRVILSWHA